jgi:eukaryotic-like serine/threonine-protein kinase
VPNGTHTTEPPAPPGYDRAPGIWSAAGAVGGVPEAIGPYRITGVLGEGGMGRVYSAEQEHPIRRRVAVKVIRAGMGESVAARLEAERQALALMEHPSIARVFDAGSTPQGSPFIVMEHVEGAPVGEYCDRRALPVRARLALFVEVCRAVQHAHQKGVIHRDLKPSNILVTEVDGTPLPKIIDFGIAKAVDRRLSDESPTTAYGLVIGTPAYMSPEQAEGGVAGLDTRTDVYALGVVLYELLAGALPVDPTESGLLPFITQLVACAAEVPPPSARLAADPDRGREAARRRGTEPGALARALRGDLDAVVLKAIAPERERRYQTAHELAVDVERYLAHQTVSARAPSLRYRAMKLARRRPASVALAVSSVAFLVGLTAVTMVQSRRVARARTVAEQRRSQAEELVSYLVGDLSARLQPIGKLELLDEAAARALGYFAAVPSSELTPDELYRRSQALVQLGQVRVNQGELTKAMPAFREALAQARDLALRDPGNADWQVQLGAGHFWVGYVHYLRGALDSALTQFRPYLDISQRLVRRDPSRAEWQLELGYAYSNLGSVREAQGDLPGALEAFRYTLGVKERLVARDPANAQWRLDLADTHNNVGLVFEKLGPLDSARAHYVADLAIKRAAAERDTANTVRRQALAAALAFAGGVEHRRGDPGAAVALYDSAYRVYERLTARDTANRAWRRDLATAELGLGTAELARGRASVAVTRLERSLRAYRALAARDPSNTDTRRQIASAEVALAEAYAAAGDVAAARVRVREAVAVLAPLAARPGAPRRLAVELARARLLDAELLDRAGSTAAATAATAARDSALAALGPARPDDDLRAAEARARALVALGRHGEAAPLLARLDRAGFRVLVPRR